jgi:hypothetical protein
MARVQRFPGASVPVAAAIRTNPGGAALAGGHPAEALAGVFTISPPSVAVVESCTTDRSCLPLGFAGCGGVVHRAGAKRKEAPCSTRVW